MHSTDGTGEIKREERERTLFIFNSTCGLITRLTEQTTTKPKSACGL